MSKDKKIIHVVANTHWDREWVYPFEETRLLLVEFMDQLIDILNKEPDFHSFTLDSQTVCLEDYLELRPEKRKDIENLVKAGKLIIGPWYSLPEEFIVNGESLVRNLLVGHRVAQSFGKVSKVGYTPFSYGQTSQMPQIYNGFGIDTIIFYRGINTPKSEFIFEGPDGSKLLGMRFGCLSRFSYYIYVYRVLRYGSDDVYAFYNWDRGAGPFRLASSARPRAHYYITDPSNKMWNIEPIRKQLEKLVHDESQHFTIPHICCMEGFDSSAPDEKEAEIVKLCQELLPEHEIRMSNLEEFMNAIKPLVKNPTVIHGESRDPGATGKWTHLMGDVISARVRVKKANHQAEMLLQRGAEPWCALSNILGKEYFRQALNRAWKLLLQNHPHDTITGGGIDQMEKDAISRAEQISIISEGLMRRALQHIYANINLSDISPKESVFVVFNPSPFKRSNVVSVYIDLPEGMGYEDFQIIDPDTNIPCEMKISQQFDAGTLGRNLQDISIELRSKRYLTNIKVDNIPAFGYKTFYIKSTNNLPALTGENIYKTPFILENEFLKISFNPDGTFDLIHKETGQNFHNLHYFEDTGETGHSWIHIEPDENETIYSYGVPANLIVEENSPLLARVRVDYTLMIPIGLERDITELDREAEKNHTRRRAEKVPLNISSYFTLKKGSQRLEVKTKLMNNARNHRLRVIFPTGIEKATHSFAEVAFDVVKRPIHIEPNSPYYGKPNPQHPMQRFVDVSDDNIGIAILNNCGLREYEVMDEPARPLAITLFRAFTFRNAPIFGRWDVYPEMELSQCLGQHEFSYAIYPHSGTWEKGAIQEAEEFNVNVEPVQAGPVKGGNLPISKSFIEIEGEPLQITSLKIAEDKGNVLIIRFYNPSENEVLSTLKFGFIAKEIWLTNLNEEPIEKLSSNTQEIKISVKPKKIITLALEFNTL
ncbi:MAG TPA: glycoside hydrolase family 38 C-terminal domain-containing protein [Candidatus Hydrogenedens sp.]|mgnify:FL=1|nr:glycoside hydrolase family 38 C-terminal domain-containing protein [Candidatus Hydrogenedens sp.]